ncbi:hypothetical protein PsorP6_010692 [Peronosclerospora sorghi]|uniref:Uncharacterized protein n=1 Tax=Peronosclerospora sorghi TaxID=230839 RepID=A0ACC0VW55_9STRA|nr:hypothetical protein PsorP6_010692 [Peronosclerospora sorghi]
MDGLLKPSAAKILVSSIRKELPDFPIHVHTHDTAGRGVSLMLEAAYSRADAVDVATYAMSALKGSKYDTNGDPDEIMEINNYWETLRGVYAPFESGQKSGSAYVYHHEMPGGQYTNLLFQSNQLGLAGQWPAIKRAYATANRLLGDIIKVTPSSKVVGDFAQFIVQNKITEQEVIDLVETLSLHKSVIEYFQGYLGILHHGFLEHLRLRALKGKVLPNGQEMFQVRPGAELEPYDFKAVEKQLKQQYGDDRIRDVGVISHAIYPEVFTDFTKFKDEYGSLHFLESRTFLTGLEVDTEAAVRKSTL